MINFVAALLSIVFSFISFRKRQKRWGWAFIGWALFNIFAGFIVVMY